MPRTQIARPTARRRRAHRVADREPGAGAAPAPVHPPRRRHARRGVGPDHVHDRVDQCQVRERLRLTSLSQCRSAPGFSGLRGGRQQPRDAPAGDQTAGVTPPGQVLHYDFLGFDHRWVHGNAPVSRHVCSVVCWPRREKMKHARNRLRELTLRKRLLLPVDEVVDLNEYLRGFAGYFRCGNSARSFGLLDEYAIERLALFLAKRHKKRRGYGYWRIASSPDRMGLIRITGTVVAPRPNQAWTGYRMPAVKNLGEPCAGKSLAQIDAAGGNQRQSGSHSRAAWAPSADPTRYGRWPAARTSEKTGQGCLMRSPRRGPRMSIKCRGRPYPSRRLADHPHRVGSFPAGGWGWCYSSARWANRRGAGRHVRPGAHGGPSNSILLAQRGPRSGRGRVCRTGGVGWIGRARLTPSGPCGATGPARCRGRVDHGP